MQWETFSHLFLTARGTSRFDAEVTPLLPTMLSRISSLSATDLQWFRQALAEDQQKWFVAFLFRHRPTVPDTLFGAMIRAAIYERNPSTNRQFVEPCIQTFGHQRVNEALLAVLEVGSDFEKAGSVNALYWAQMSLLVAGTKSVWSFDYDKADPDHRAHYDQLEPIWQWKRRLFLQEFVLNPSVDVRRSIIASLEIDPTSYPEDLKPLVITAIEIARSHTDDYIRHRLALKTGAEQLIKPLPQRE